MLCIAYLFFCDVSCRQIGGYLDKNPFTAFFIPSSASCLSKISFNTFSYLSELSLAFFILFIIHTVCNVGLRITEAISKSSYHFL